MEDSLKILVLAFLLPPCAFSGHLHSSPVDESPFSIPWEVERGSMWNDVRSDDDDPVFSNWSIGEDDYPLKVQEGHKHDHHHRAKTHRHHHQNIKRMNKRKVSVSGGSVWYPKTPVNLPIVGPQMVQESESLYSKLIPTKQKPFHFHIPITIKQDSSNDLSAPNDKWDELETLAKMYKDPLNYDSNAIMTSVTDIPVTRSMAGREALMRRMVRDSPVLDFLNLAMVLGKEHDLEEDGLMGDKRSVLQLQPTDEVLQELVGDEDDLLRMQTEKQKHNDVRRRHRRQKRGLMKWIGKVFGKKTTTTPRPTTTATTSKPKPKSNSRGKDKGQKYFVLRTNSEGDTEVDALLPKALRRSYYLKNVKQITHVDDGGGLKTKHRKHTHHPTEETEEDTFKKSSRRRKKLRQMPSSSSEE